MYNLQSIIPLISYKRGSTNLSRIAIFDGQEIGEVTRMNVMGKRMWTIEEVVGKTFEEAAATYILRWLITLDEFAKEEPIAQPTFSDYDPMGLMFPNGDEVVGFWFIEDGTKYHLAIDKEGREYETSDEPIKKGIECPICYEKDYCIHCDN